MIRIAVSRSNLPTIHADGAALPFGSASFNTVIVTTGVLDIAEESVRKEICAEGLRVLSPSGHLILGLFSPSRPVLSAGQDIGYMDGLRLYQDRICEFWLLGHDEAAWSRVVSKWRNIPLAQAVECVRTHKQTLISIYQNVGNIATAAQELGQKHKSYMRAAFDYCLFGSPIENHANLLIDVGGTSLRSFREPLVSTATLLVGKEPAVGRCA